MARGDVRNELVCEVAGGGVRNAVVCKVAGEV